MTISKIYKCQQCCEIKSKAHFYRSTKDPNDTLNVCIKCFKENRIRRTAGMEQSPGKDRRCRREREYAALNHKRQNRIDDAEKLLTDFDARVKTLEVWKNPQVRRTLASTYQQLQRQIDEAVAEAVL